MKPPMANRWLAADSHSNKSNQGCGEDIDEVVTEQDKPDDSVGALQEFLGELRAAMTLPGFVAKLVAVQAHERRFRAREKGGKQQEHNKQDYQACQ